MSNIDKNEFRKYAVKHHRINSIYVDKFIAGVERSYMPSSGFFASPTAYTTPNVIEERQMNGSVIDADGSQPAVSGDYFYIVTDKCTECKGFHDEPQCASVCPVDCCVADMDHVESEESLLAKKAKLHLA